MAALAVPAEEGRILSVNQTLQNRFVVAVVAFRRSRQLQDGARPRVLAGRHKPAQLAVLEVLADTVSWSLT